MPAETPVIFTEVLDTGEIVATVVGAMVHEPPEVVVLSSIVAFTQTTPGPVIAPGSGLKETV